MKLAGIIRQDSGVGYYRIAQPIQFVDRISKEKSRITPFTGKGQIIRIAEGDPNAETLSDQTLMEICKDAEVMWSTMITNDDEILKMLNLRHWSGAKWVVDMDDDIYNIPVDNKNKYKVEALIPKIELCLQLADGITVSVPRLKDTYKHLNPNIFVNPNGQDIDFWKKLQRSHNNKKIRIGWRGAVGHGADLRLIEPAIKAIQKDYDVEFVTIGARPPFKTKHQDWVGCLEYPKAMRDLQIDIALVPLVDSPYNKCKSNIAVQEFSMLKIPVVASPVENQLDWPCSYAVTNFEWYSEIEKLIKSRELRVKQGKKQFDHCAYHYDLKKLSKPLMKWFNDLERKNIEK